MITCERRSILRPISLFVSVLLLLAAMPHPAQPAEQDSSSAETGREFESEREREAALRPIKMHFLHESERLRGRARTQYAVGLILGALSSVGVILALDGDEVDNGLMAISGVGALTAGVLTTLAFFSDNSALGALHRVTRMELTGELATPAEVEELEEETRIRREGPVRFRTGEQRD